MTLPWSAAQVEWLQAMGLEVLRDARAPAADAAPAPAEAADVPAALRRAARGVDLAPLLAAYGVPRDIASRRVFWRALRPLRRAAGAG